MNEFQALTYSALLAALAIIWLFYGFGNDDDEGGGKMIPLRQGVR
tara:strand:+ start:812 stop:946 length:135 start_codon:yes stop_codon:yes gene_type:complete